MPSACAHRSKSHPAPASASEAAASASEDSSPATAPAVESAPREHLDVPTATSRARAALLKFSQESWSSASAPAGEALLAISDLLESGASCVDRSVSRSSGELRARADRLAHAGERRPEVEQGGWIKAALVVASDALEVVRPSTRETVPWKRAARDAVMAIDDHATLAFARGPIQGAMRATVDAAIVVLATPCTVTAPGS